MGFLSALGTMPLTLSEGLHLETVMMGPTRMRFAKTTPDGHSVVVGLSEDRPDVVEEIFNAVDGINWGTRIQGH